jgi:hypothetical protein
MPIADLSPLASRPAFQMRRAGDVVVPKASSALVPVNPAARTAALSSGLARPDPSFVTHLIAMAEQDPQTRVLRRAAITDVEAAYRAAANQNQAVRPNGLRTHRTA